MPHRLELYETCVQQPLAEVRLLSRMAKQTVGLDAFLLREDFAGGAALAEAWCLSDPERQAMAIELDPRTAAWSRKQRGDVDDLHLVEADVMDVASPKVDLTAALNFSTFIYHSRAELLRYFKHARRGLRREGVFILDAFGGPGAQRPGSQHRTRSGVGYTWEQRSFDAATHRIDCRIHFDPPDAKPMRSAFRYDWRLWSLPELSELLDKAGFSHVQAWAENKSGRYKPVDRLRITPEREDWVAYLVAVR